LNFYSFRKINRERNVWIYQHQLFHRDHPEDLYQVRRRTCPGLDGRKIRVSSRKSSKKDGSSSDDDSISQEEPSALLTAAETIKKRNSLNSVDSGYSDPHLETEEYQPRPKKTRTSAPSSQSESPVVDTSKVRPAQVDMEPEDDSSMDKRYDRVEMMQQSLVVSDVAMKLEEYARKARKDRGISTKPRRAGAGVVTPPFDTNYQSVVSATELLTYDDEYDSDDDDEFRAKELFCNQTSSVVTDSDVEDGEDNNAEASRLQEALMTAPVDTANAKAITERLLGFDVTSVAVAGFCMSTAPGSNPDLSQKVLQLIGSCEALAFDFHQYRNALKPAVHSGELPFHDIRMELVRNWEREGSRSAAVRDFKVFSVNCVHKILGKNRCGEGVTGLTNNDRAALERTANAWLRSVSTADFMQEYVF